MEIFCVMKVSWPLINIRLNAIWKLWHLWFDVISFQPRPAPGRRGGLITANLQKGETIKWLIDLISLRCYTFVIHYFIEMLYISPISLKVNPGKFQHLQHTCWFKVLYLFFLFYLENLVNKRCLFSASFQMSSFLVEQTKHLFLSFSTELSFHVLLK